MGGEGQIHFTVPLPVSLCRFCLEVRV